ncbi:hypothetical protein C8R43DRAFT_956742, partial [Mycena crocata]
SLDPYPDPSSTLNGAKRSITVLRLLLPVHCQRPLSKARSQSGNGIRVTNFHNAKRSNEVTKMAWTLSDSQLEAGRPERTKLVLLDYSITVPQFSDLLVWRMQQEKSNGRREEATGGDGRRGVGAVDGFHPAGTVRTASPAGVRGTEAKALDEQQIGARRAQRRRELDGRRNEVTGGNGRFILACAKLLGSNRGEGEEERPPQRDRHVTSQNGRRRKIEREARGGDGRRREKRRRRCGWVPSCRHSENGLPGRRSRNGGESAGRAADWSASRAASTGARREAKRGDGRQREVHPCLREAAGEQSRGGRGRTTAAERSARDIPKRTSQKNRTGGREEATGGDGRKGVSAVDGFHPAGTVKMASPAGVREREAKALDEQQIGARRAQRRRELDGRQNEVTGGNGRFILACAKLLGSNRGEGEEERPPQRDRHKNRTGGREEATGGDGRKGVSAVDGFHPAGTVKMASLAGVRGREAKALDEHRLGARSVDGSSPEDKTRQREATGRPSAPARSFPGQSREGRGRTTAAERSARDIPKRKLEKIEREARGGDGRRREKRRHVRSCVTREEDVVGTSVSMGAGLQCPGSAVEEGSRFFPKRKEMDITGEGGEGRLFYVEGRNQGSVPPTSPNSEGKRKFDRPAAPSGTPEEI